MTDLFAPLTHHISRINLSRPIGRVRSVAGGTICVNGLHRAAALGDRIEIGPRELGKATQGGVDDSGGEVIGLGTESVTVLPDHGLTGLAIGTEIALSGPTHIAPDDSWIGRVIDPLGQPLDGRPLFAGPQHRSLTASPPPPAQRRRLGARLATGKAAFDTVLPIVRGQRIGLFAGSGVGKSSLLGTFARALQADVVVIALVGERGRELREFTESVLGPDGMKRSVVIAATSDRSPLLRRRCALAAMTVAEHFRDKGLNVLLLVDSVTRFALTSAPLTICGQATCAGFRRCCGKPPGPFHGFGGHRPPSSSAGRERHHCHWVPSRRCGKTRVDANVTLRS